jgi:hypothetical protein
LEVWHVISCVSGEDEKPTQSRQLPIDVPPTDTALTACHWYSQVTYLTGQAGAAEVLARPRGKNARINETPDTA